jgi:Uma2 family endonuclease
MSRPTAAHWTYQDLLRIPDEGDGKRYEIIEGERFVTPSPFEPHQRASMNLVLMLGPFVVSRELGKVYHAPIDVVLADHTVLVPDIVFVAKARASIIEHRGIFGPPDLIVEILSKSTKSRDIGVKLRAYGAHGVREYWVLDPDRRRIAVFTLQGQELVKAAEHDSGDVVSPVVLPGFSASLDRIFGTPPASR